MFVTKGGKNMWNYRIIRYKNNSGYGLHEVYYNDMNVPYTYTENPVGFACDLGEGSDGVKKSLEIALIDANKHPVLDENDIDVTSPLVSQTNITDDDEWIATTTLNVAEQRTVDSVDDKEKEEGTPW